MGVTVVVGAACCARAGRRVNRATARRLALAALLALAGCASTPPLPAEVAELRAGTGQALLLGETHDNAAQHALRRDLLAALLARGDRPALLLEQLDRERQSALDAQVDAVVQHAGRGVVLLAGNGHVRTDIGVPRWLPADLRARTRVVGALEADGIGIGTYDTILRTAAPPRTDPCAGLHMPAPSAAIPGHAAPTRP